MRMKSALALCALTLAVLMVAPLAAWDDGPPGAASYKLEKVSMPGFKGHVQLLAWTVVDGKNSVVFANDDVEGPSDEVNYLRSFTLNRNGKAGKTTTLLDFGGGRISQAAAFCATATAAATSSSSISAN